MQRLRNCVPWLATALMLCALAAFASAQDNAATPEPAATAASSAQSAPSAPGSAVASLPAPPASAALPAPVPELSLMTMIKQGGAILWAIIVMGFVALVWSLYLLFTVTTSREAPRKLAKRALAQVLEGDIRGAYQMCSERDELLANVLAAGLKMAGHDREVIQKAMESEGSRGAAELWQRIALLNHIGTLAPLVGLLGTVWGMMQAFVAIAADLAQVQAMAMAAGVSKAMINTAAGLMLAIPSLAVHYYLRGRVARIVTSTEQQANEFVEAIVEHAPAK